MITTPMFDWRCIYHLLLCRLISPHHRLIVTLKSLWYRSVSQGDITPILKATRDAVTDIMRGVLAKVTQFSKNGLAENEHDKRSNGNSNSSSSSSSGSSSNGHGNGHSNGRSHHGMDGNSDDIIIQLNKEKNALERRVRMLEEEKERSVAMAHKADNASSSSSSSSALGNIIQFIHLLCFTYILTSSFFSLPHEF